MDKTKAVNEVRAALLENGFAERKIESNDGTMYRDFDGLDKAELEVRVTIERNMLDNTLVVTRKEYSRSGTEVRSLSVEVVSEKTLAEAEALLAA